jgi:hypothetical protein
LEEVFLSEDSAADMLRKKKVLLSTNSEGGEVDNVKFYEVLGLPKNASQDDIKKQYR